MDVPNFSCEIALNFMPTDLTDAVSTLIQGMDWCRQATITKVYPTLRHHMLCRDRATMS